jgi:N-acetyl-anhydromuramyl-L-alanine amidase AmpD
VVKRSSSTTTAGTVITCFSVLQNERGLSRHFLLDNDGTIFQTIDFGLMAITHRTGTCNRRRLCNRGDA